MSDNNEFTHELVVYTTDLKAGTMSAGDFITWNNDQNYLDVENQTRMKIGGGNDGDHLATDGEGNLSWKGANFAQSNANQVTATGDDTTFLSVDIETTGRPVQIIACGDANCTTVGGGWVRLRLYRDGIAIGKTVQAETTVANCNIPFTLTFIDTPAAGEYTYTARVVDMAPGKTWQFSENTGGHMTLVEL